jgi:hypothetical protein
LQTLKPLQTSKQWRGARLPRVRNTGHSTTRHPSHSHPTTCTAATTSAAAFGHQVSRARLRTSDNARALLVIVMPLKPVRELCRMRRRTGFTGRTRRTRRTTSRHALALKLSRCISFSLSRSSRIYAQCRLPLLLQHTGIGRSRRGNRRLLCNLRLLSRLSAHQDAGDDQSTHRSNATNEHLPAFWRQRSGFG